MRGRLRPDLGMVQLGGIVDYEAKFLKAKRIIFIACGTSWHAGLVGESLFEEYARVYRLEYASEFRYRNPVIYEDDIVMGVALILRPQCTVRLGNSTTFSGISTMRW